MLNNSDLPTGKTVSLNVFSGQEGHLTVEAYTRTPFSSKYLMSSPGINVDC